MKKNYQEPCVTSIIVNMQHHLLNDSVKNIEGNASLNYKGGGSGPARGRQGNSWEDGDE